MDLADPRTKKILLIDDDPGHIDIMKHVLVKEGFQVFSATTSDEAKASIKSLDPDMITMDLMMPDMTGLEMIRYLQAEGFGSIPIVVITGRYSDIRAIDEKLVRMEPNVVDFIKKPLRPAMF